MPRAAKIAAIQAERAGNADAADRLRARLDEIGAALATVDRIRVDLLPRVEDDARTRLAAWAVPIRELADSVAREQSALERALARLRRQSLNIGMVGRARQGKSRFLQSLTGLTAREIPDGQGRFCTGVPSTVQHVAGVDTYADVYFHSAASFLGEVIGPYYDQLKLGPPPASPAEFSRGPLPPLPPGPTPEAESAYRHLSTYHRTFPDYGTLIGAPLRRVAADEIRGFVAQDDEAGHEVHAFRAVRRVQIFTAFPHDDLGGIGVIDLPGLGDTNLGDSQVMLSALQDDVDVVLFLRRPNPEGDGIHDYDIALYHIAKNALPEIPMERRSFLILNHRASTELDNLARCEEFREQVADSAIRVVATEIADCSSPGQVAAQFEPVVDYLLANIGELDRMLLAERNRRAAEIQQEARLLVRELSSLGVLAQPTSQWFPVFLSLFGAAYEELSVGIEGLVKEYKAERGTPDPTFSAAVRAALDRARADDGIPSEPEIERSFALYGGQVLAYGHLLNETRAHLSRHFLELDVALKECVEQMWRRTAAVLRAAGQLGPLTEQTGREFLVSLGERIPPGLGFAGRSEVRYALEVLTGFELPYRSFIQHRIRHCLDGMDIDRPKIGFAPQAPPPDAATVAEALAIAYQETLAECAAQLTGLLSEPNQAVFGIVEEFRDRVLRSRGVPDEWRAIYEDIRAEIWTDRFDALAERAVHLRTWNDAVQQLGRLLAAGPGGGPAAAPSRDLAGAAS
jgi:hypothetical protein